MDEHNDILDEVGLEAIGIAITVVGIVKVIDSLSIERQLQVGDKVYPNDTIMTTTRGTVLIEFFNGTHLDLSPASQIELNGEILELATAKSELLTFEQIQAMIARGEDPAPIGSGNNWLSAVALRGNVLGAEARADSVVTSANMMAVTPQVSIELAFTAYCISNLQPIMSIHPMHRMLTPEPRKALAIASSTGTEARRCQR